MNRNEIIKLKRDTFIICTKYYLELENNICNMCDAELCVPKEEITKQENISTSLNVFLNRLANDLDD